MNDNLLLSFIIFSTINVVIQTGKSIITFKCGKFAAALANAVAYGLYTYILVLTMCDLPITIKMIVTAAVNFVGVYFVKWIEEKTEKEKLWKVELTVPQENCESLHKTLEGLDMPHHYIPVGKYVVFNCYCATRKDSSLIKIVADKSGAKYFATESKNF